MATGIKTQAGMVMKHLWTNSSPTTEVASGTKIEVDLTNYDAVMIYYMAATDVQRVSSLICLKNSTQHILMTVDPGTTAVRARYATVADDGVTMGPGYSNTTNAKKHIIPYKIYGIKGL